VSEPTPWSNKGRTLAFRDEVVLYLQHEGFEHVTRRRDLSRAKLSEILREDAGDIIGLPWALSVHRKKTIDLSDALENAEFQAHTARTKLYATVHHRRGAGVASAYVTMPMSVFVEVLRSTLDPVREAPTLQ
jgi:hypothetical protein